MRRSIEWYHGLFVFFLFLAALSVISMLLPVIDPSMMRVESIFELKGLALNAIASLVAMVLTPIAYLKLLNVPMKRFYSVQRVPIKQLVVAIVGVIAVGSCLDILFSEIATVAPWIKKGLISFLSDLNFHEMLAQSIRSGTVFTLILFILFIGVVPGIAEEFMFRGFVQRVFQDGMPLFLAIGLSGGMFAVLHVPQQFDQAMAAFFISFFLGYVFYRSGNLSLAVICHALNNSLFVLLVYLDPNTSVDEPMNPLWLVLFIPLAVAAFWYFAKQVQPPEPAVDDMKRTLNELGD